MIRRYVIVYYNHSGVIRIGVFEAGNLREALNKMEEMPDIDHVITVREITELGEITWKSGKN